MLASLSTEAYRAPIARNYIQTADVSGVRLAIPGQATKEIGQAAVTAS